MKAKIKSKNKKSYDTIVFAIIPKGWKTEVIAFDENNENLRIIDYWSTSLKKGIIRHVFLLESNCEDWKEDTKLSGYNWFISNSNIIKNIKKKQQIDFDIFEHCKKLLNSLKIENEGEITNKTEINNIMGVAQYFHDAYVQDITKEKDKIIINLNTTWGCGIIFCLEGNPFTNLEKDFGRIGEILDSSMFMQDDRIYWVNCDGIVNAKDILEEDRYFCANKVFWKLEIY